MKIAVVTPYYKEPLEVIRRAHESVKSQTVPVDHILVADGFARPEIDGWDARHISLPNHADYGDTPRLVGAASAASLDYEALLLLDADNWFEPTHVAAMVDRAVKTQADIVTCSRRLIRTDGTVLGDCQESDGAHFNDTNCYLLTRRAFPLMQAWGFKDPKLGIVGDRIFWDAVKAAPLPRIHARDIRSVNYVTSFAVHYAGYGECPPEDAKVIAQTSNGLTMMNWRAYGAAFLAQGSEIPLWLKPFWATQGPTA